MSHGDQFSDAASELRTAVRRSRYPHFIKTTASTRLATLQQRVQSVAETLEHYAEQSDRLEMEGEADFPSEIFQRAGAEIGEGFFNALDRAVREGRIEQSTADRIGALVVEELVSKLADVLASK